MTKRHLMKTSGIPTQRAACGLINPSRWTRNPQQVTCLTCRGSLYMADLEITRARPTRRNKGKGNG